jgi:O-antigen/teichoic acid export membrane protein
MSPTTAAAEEPARLGPRPLSLTWNSLALIAAKVATMGLGFLFWLAAARMFEASDVGVAAGLVAAMMLCTQIALLGIGSAVIVLYPAHQRHPGPLLDTAMTMVAISGLVASAAFLLLATGAFSQLDVATSSAVYAGLFIAASVLGTQGILLDQTATALRRGDQALTRNLVFGIGALVALGGGAVLASRAGSEGIFMPWALAGVAACALGLWQLRRALGRYRMRPRLERRAVGRLWALGVPNHVLTLAERSPGLVLPILVTELLSPADNAVWYGVWMMAWVIFIVPVQVGMTMFSEVSHDPGSRVRTLRKGIRTSLVIGVGGALAVVAAAELVLSLLGPSYAAAGATPLRILALGVIPMTFMHAYFALCRAEHRLGEAIATGWASAVAAVLAACVAGLATGLDGMAVAWVAVQSVTGAFSAWRVHRLLRVDTPGRRPAMRPARAGTAAAVEMRA